MHTYLSKILFQDYPHHFHYKRHLLKMARLIWIEKEFSTGTYAYVDLKYKQQFSDDERPTPLVKLRKIQQDIKKAKEYAISKGIEKPIFYLIACNANNFEDITGNPILYATTSVANRLWEISQNE